MDVNIEEMNSRISITDVDRMAAAVLKKVRDAQEHEKQVQDERAMRPGVSSRNLPNWA
jgi:hypothetical protein